MKDNELFIKNVKKRIRLEIIYLKNYVKMKKA